MGVKKTDNLLFLPETDVDQVVESIRDLRTKGSGLVIIDSIQTLTTGDFSSSAGSVGQVRESALRLLASRDFDLIFGIGFMFSRDITAIANEFPENKKRKAPPGLTINI